MEVDPGPLQSVSADFERPALSYTQGAYSGYNPLFAGNQVAPNRAADWNWLSLYFSTMQSSLQSGAQPTGTRLTNAFITGLFLPDMTLGSVLFVGAGGQVSQNNPSLFWDNSAFSLNQDNGAAAANVAHRFRVAGDTQNRFQISADGTNTWGGGSATPNISMQYKATSVPIAGPSVVFNGVDTRVFQFITIQTGSSGLAVAGDIFAQHTSGGAGRACRSGIIQTRIDHAFNDTATVTHAVEGRFRFTANATGGTHSDASVFCSFFMTEALATKTLTNLVYYDIQQSELGASAVGTAIGFYARTFPATTTTKISLESDDSAATMRHLGFVSIGKTTVPSYQLDVAVSTATGTPNISINQAGTGDPVYFATIAGGNSFAWGIDNSDADSWKLSYGSAANAALGTNDYLTVLVGGNIGINTTGPDRKLDILDASNPQLRLTFTDGSVFTDFTAGSDGRLTIGPSGTLLLLDKTSSGGEPKIEVINRSNTASSNSAFEANVAGTSAGDPYIKFTIASGASWACGSDNSDSDKFKISGSSALGTSDVISMTTTGGISHTIVSGANEFSINDSQGDCDFRVEGDSLSHMIFMDATSTTENIALVATTAPNWQSMDNGLFIGNVATAPTGNPASGHYYYDNAGIPTWRSSGGAIMNLSQATGGQNVTNSVTDTASTNGTIPDITNGAVYATDYTNLRNALFQLARMLKQDHDQLRAMGILT